MMYVGIDLHRKRSHVAALDEEGQLVLSRRVQSRPGEFLRVFGELGKEPIEVAFEATFGWGWLADLRSTPACQPTWPTHWPPRPSQRAG